jgi:hypothetical protein
VIYQLDTAHDLPYDTGAVQWNGALKQFEVSTGGSWQKINNTVVLETSKEVTEVIAWARKKMQEEEELKLLCNKYPSLDAAWQHYEFIREIVREQT